MTVTIGTTTSIHRGPVCAGGVPERKPGAGNHVGDHVSKMRSGCAVGTHRVQRLGYVTFVAVDPCNPLRAGRNAELFERVGDEVLIV